MIHRVNRNLLRILLDEGNRAIGRDHPLLDHAGVIPCAASGDELLLKIPTCLHLVRQLEARHTRLTDLYVGVANAVDIADVDLCFKHPCDGEVFTKLPDLKVITPKLGLPCGVMLMRIEVDGLMHPTVYLEVGLFVAV